MPGRPLTNTIYELCVSEGFTGDSLTECVSNGLQKGVDTFFIIFATSLIFFMQAGFAMICAGVVRSKNVRNTMLKNLLDACGAALGFYTIGYGLAYGGSTDGGPTTFAGNSNFFMMDLNKDFYLDPLVSGQAYWLFQFAFAATSATIVAGTVAERCQMTAYLGYSISLTAFIYPIVAHALWSPQGFLSISNANPLFGIGALDFSGGGVVHVTGGITALLATKILGARRGRFHDNKGNPLPKPATLQQHSIALQFLGVFILWFGFYGFNAGSALIITNPNRTDIAIRTAISTTLAGASGCVSALFSNLVYQERVTGEATFDVGHSLNGCLAGLVSITAGCAVVEPWAAIIIGTVAGWFYLICSNMLIAHRLDDAVEAIPVHLAAGSWGIIATGLFAVPSYMEQVTGTSAHPGWFYSWGRGSADGRLLAANIVEIVFIIVWVSVTMGPFFLLLNYIGWFRSDSLEEVVGLDISYHGGAVSPDDAPMLEYVEAMKIQRQLAKTGLRSRRKGGDDMFDDEEIMAHAMEASHPSRKASVKDSRSASMDFHDHHV